MIFFFFWPCCTACRILVPQPGVESMPPSLGLWNHWATREAPRMNIAHQDYAELSFVRGYFSSPAIFLFSLKFISDLLFSLFTMCFVIQPCKFSVSFLCSLPKLCLYHLFSQFYFPEKGAPRALTHCNLACVSRSAWCILVILAFPLTVTLGIPFVFFLCGWSHCFLHPISSFFVPSILKFHVIFLGVGLFPVCAEQYMGLFNLDTHVLQTGNFA